MSTPKSYLKSIDEVDLSILNDTILIIPSVSIGNVPQLATDLLIQTFDFTRIAHLKDQYLYPFASPIDYSVSQGPQPGISTALELYYSEKHKLTLVQQRSPIIPTFAKKFVQDVMVPFINDMDFKEILLLDSGDSGLKENIVPDYIETYTNEDLLSKSMESLKLSDNVMSLNDVVYGHSPYFKYFISELTGKLSLNVLVIFVYEGQNFYEANVLANKVATKLELTLPETSWITPISWQGVYGDKPVPTSMEEGIYG